MSEARPFYTRPGSVWLLDPALNGCSEPAINLLTAIADSSDKNWRIEVSPVNHAFSVRQCFKDPIRFRRWSEERISQCLAELRARGCLLLATANGREWLEVSDRLCYCKGHKAERSLDPPEQLPLPEPMAEGSLFALLPDIGMRGEKKERRIKPDSRARGRPDAGNVNNSGEESRNRLLSQGKGRAEGDGRWEMGDGGEPSPQTPTPNSNIPTPNDRFARPMEALLADPLGKRLSRFIGLRQSMEEMERSGARWMQMLTEDADVLGELIDQCEIIAGTEGLDDGRKRVKWLWKRMTERRVA